MVFSPVLSPCQSLWVAKITEELCGTEVTSMQVSRAAVMLDEELEAWRTRPLSQVREPCRSCETPATSIPLAGFFV